MASVHRIPFHCLRYSEDQQIDPSAVESLLAATPSISHVAFVHSETSSGIFNPAAAIASAAKRARPGCVVIVDAMSSFGAVPLPLEHVDYAITSSNKCLQGCPGFAVVLARLQHLATTQGHARTLSLDLHAQWRAFKETRQFRFTPPTHAMLAFFRALEELEAEGGVERRAERYRENQRVVLEGMARLGFRAYLSEGVRGYIISTFHYLEDPRFEFSAFYGKLNERGCVIYPGKLTKENCFRIGNIGYLSSRDMHYFIQSVESVLKDMLK